MTPSDTREWWAFFLASLGLQEILKEEPCRWLDLATAVVRLDVKAIGSSGSQGACWLNLSPQSPHEEEGSLGASSPHTHD